MAGWHLSEQARQGRRRRRGRRLRSRATGHRGAAVRAGHELRRQGVSYAQAVEQLAALPHIEEAEQIDPLETVQVPTPAVAMLDELASQQAAQHPIEGDGRIGTLHHLLALLMVPRGRPAGCRGSWGSSMRWCSTVPWPRVVTSRDTVVAATTLGG